MDNLDYSLVELIDQHAKERKAAEWQEKVEAAKRAGSNAACIEFLVITIISIILAFCLETPH